MSFVIGVTGQLIVDYRARDWCRMSYPDHPNGCPNFDHKPVCPPEVCLIKDFVSLKGPLWFVVETFDLQEHITKMKNLHPDWSSRQARCVLYWQSGVNKRLRVCGLVLDSLVAGSESGD